MHRIYLLLACIATALISAPNTALADGKVFLALAENASTATMPDQQALIHFKNGVETLAIETRFVGAAENFAWVVPLPAVPEITPATPGLFKTLRAMHQPKIVARYQGLHIIWIPAVVMLLLAIARPHWFIRLLLLTLVVAMVAVLMLPTLGKARGSASDDPGSVTELSRQLVGDFEVAVVESREPDALVKWLKEHGFGVPPAAEKVIASYVSDGWVFAAAKMRGDLPANPDAVRTPHPLVFKFPVRTPVYPMRLTGVENNGPLSVELYVLADQRAEAPGFTVTRCGAAEYADASHWWARAHRGPQVPISHSWLRQHTPGAAVATKLVGTLAPEQMTSDVELRFVPQRDVWPRRWTPGAALGRAIDVSLGVLTVGLVGVLATSRTRGWTPRMRAAPLWGPWVLAAMSGGVVYAATDLAGDVRNARIVDASTIFRDVQSECWTQVQAGEPIEEEWLRTTTSQIAQRNAGKDAVAPIEEDSPGNYQIRQLDGEWLFIWHDYFGNEHVYDALTPPLPASTTP